MPRTREAAENDVPTEKQIFRRCIDIPEDPRKPAVRLAVRGGCKPGRPRIRNRQCKSVQFAHFVTFADSCWLSQTSCCRCATKDSGMSELYFRVLSP